MRLKTAIASVVLLGCLSPGVSGQDQTLSIESCYARALTGNPLQKNHDLFLKEKALKMDNLGTNFLPDIQLSAEAKYLSKVINLNSLVTIPGLDIPSPPNEQYNLSLNVNQVIYDGGMTRSQKDMEAAAVRVKDQSLNVDLYQIKERINMLYFGILFQQKNDTLFQLSRKILSTQITKAEAAVDNGVLLASELDALHVEALNLEENMLANRHNISKGFVMLGELIDSVIPKHTRLIDPTVILDFEAPVSRPELALFDYRNNQVELGKKLISARNRPLIAGFGQAGYGQPGLNPVNTNFDTWYLVGLRLSWKFWDWNQGKREKELLQLQQQNINNQRENFDQNLSIELKSSIEEINKYKALLAKDREIIRLRERILSTAASRLRQGVITSADYVRDFNNYLAVRVQHNIHTLQLEQAKMNYLTTKGNHLGEP